MIRKFAKILLIIGILLNQRLLELPDYRYSFESTIVGRLFLGDGSSYDEWRDYGVTGDDYEGPPVFDDDQYEEEMGVVLRVEEESMPVYDTYIEDVIEEEEGLVNKGGIGGGRRQHRRREELENLFFEGDCSSSNEWGDYGMAGDDYEGAP
ncbi:hypothetical protein Tco_1290711, partial [Tanacetum coccineum]